ncbi:MAG: hypothetical protein EOO68_37675, partial [Moraxellaceae bacterium]
IYTGGTIGMDAGENGLTASSNFSEKFFRAFPEYKKKFTPQNSVEATSDIDFDFIEYQVPVDSSHADLQFAVKIYHCIYDRSDDIDRWLVLMGSDTLPYIAACLGYLFHQSTLPIIVSGAMKPLTEPNSDAILNVRFALENLQLNPLQGVHVVFGGQLLSAVRCTKLYANRADAIVDTTAENTSPIPRRFLNVNTPKQKNDFTDFDIRVIRVAPSMHTRFVRNALAGCPDAVLIQCYGSGTAPAENSEFAQAIKELKRKEVPLFAISQTMDAWVDFSIYAASAWLSELDIVRCGDMNLEAAYTKLWYLLNHDFSGSRLSEAMQLNLCGEISQQIDVE